MSPRAAAFAWDVIARTEPEGRERAAKSLLWAADKLADYATPLGLEAVPGVLLHPHHAELATAMGNICRAGNHPPPGMLRRGPAARAHPRARVRRRQPHRPAAAGFLIDLCDLCDLRAIQREQPRRHILTHVPVAL